VGFSGLTIYTILDNQYLYEQFDTAELERINTLLRELASQKKVTKNLCCS
jgi:hypothetical protein